MPAYPGCPGQKRLLNKLSVFVTHLHDSLEMSRVALLSKVLPGTEIMENGMVAFCHGDTIHVNVLSLVIFSRMCKNETFCLVNDTLIAKGLCKTVFFPKGSVWLLSKNSRCWRGRSTMVLKLFSAPPRISSQPKARDPSLKK